MSNKKINIQEIIRDLTENFKFGNVYLFLDLDINKYVIINYNSSDKFDTMKMYDKQSIEHLIKSMLHTRLKSGEIEYFKFDAKNIKLIVNAVQGVKKSFHRSKDEFFVDTDYLPTLNLFKRTSLLNYNPTKKIEYSELKTILDTKYPRLNILLKNNIGDDDYIEWFLNWIAMEINNPLDIKTTFIIIGEQGSGKSVLVEEIFKENIYHFSNVSVLDNKTLKDNFNDIYNYKSFIVMNEVSTMDLKENNQIAQDLKRLITDGSYINRAMFKAGVEKKKTFNICFTTNKNEPVQIENGDRRFSVFGRGKKLLEMEEVKELNKSLNETFDTFIKNTKKEIREFLYFVKSLNYDSNVAINPIMTSLKEKIIAKTNTKEDLFKSYFNTKDIKSIMRFLSNFDFSFEQTKINDFEKKFELMFKNGIFDNAFLFHIYTNIYELEENDYNKSSIEKKSGAFWSKLLSKPKQPKIFIKGATHNFKVFNENAIDVKKETLRKIISSDTIPVEFYDKDENLAATAELDKDGNLLDENGNILF